MTFPHTPVIAAMVAVFPISACLAANAFSHEHAVLPRDQWVVSSSDGGSADFRAEGGAMEIDFRVPIQRLHQVGHEAYQTGTLDLLLKEPVVLSQETARIGFEAIGNEWKSWNARENQVRLRPLVRDAEGEVLVYNAFPAEKFYFPKGHPATKNDSGPWRQWLTRDFRTSEAGAATQDVFEVREGKGNNFPDFPLTFLGFEVEVRSSQKGVKTGKLVLGGYETVGGQLAETDPWFFADAVCTKKGVYRLGYEVSNEFQGLPIRSASTEFTYDPDDVASRRQKILFELGPRDNYWISYRLVGPDGEIVASDHFRSQIYQRGGKMPERIAATQAPAVGCLRVNPEKNTNGVYAVGEPLEVVMRVFQEKGQGRREISWELLGYDFPEVLAKGESSVPDGAPYRDVTVRLAAPEGRDMFRMRIRVRADGRVLDEVTYYLGRQTAFARERHPKPAPLCDRNFVKAGAYNRATLVKLSSVKFASEAEALKYYEDRLDAIQKITPYVTYLVDVRDIQPLPGVYNFSFTNKLMDAAAARGMAVTVRFGHIDDEGEFTWLKYSRQVNYDGTEIPEHYYGGFSVTDQGYTQFWLDAFRAFYKQYGSHPAFQGYYLLQPAGEFTVSDKPWEGLVSDYSPPAQEAFRLWLKDNRGWSLEELNKRWGTSYQSWNEVEAPLPDFSLGRRPDLRLSWIDFSRFKAWLDRDYWQKRALADIRSYDPDRVVINYCDPDAVEGMADYGHNGGNHFFENLGAYMDAWYEHGTGWITEPHQPNKWADYGDPGERGWVLDWSVWIAFAQAGAGASNLHVYYHPQTADLIWHYGAEMGLDRMQRFFPIMEELHDMEMQLPRPEVAFLFDPHTLYAKHRSTFFQRMWDLKRWGELLDRDNVAFRRFKGTLSPHDLDGVKLILTNPLDEVMSGENIDAITRAVTEGGARLVTTANTGRYSPEHAGEDFVLLQRLGIKPPAGEFDTDAGSITATATKSTDGLFQAGETIRFFSLADLKKDLQSDEIHQRENFWKYPYRWLPLTDYFGYYPESTGSGGDVLAKFKNGAAAITLHQAGKGEVIVFWGLPDYKPENMPGVMARLAKWAGAGASVSDNPLPLMREGRNTTLNRHYALIYNDRPGTYRQKITFLPDGDWFIDDMVSDQRLGRASGAAAREEGVELKFDQTFSPLKVLRFIPIEKNLSQTRWPRKYPDLTPEAGKSTSK